MSDTRTTPMLHCCACIGILALFCPGAWSQEDCPRVAPPSCADPDSGRRPEPVYRVIRDGRLLGSDGARTLLERFVPASDEDREDRRAAEVCLVQALEDQGNEVMRRYVKGDEMPPQLTMYRCGAGLFEAANQLRRSDRLEARALFFRARVLLLSPDPQRSPYQDAIEYLKKSVEKDPKDTYHYNALGLAYLAQEKYNEASDWFKRAKELESKWFYPRHHLALISIEKGEYQAARVQYKELIDEAEKDQPPLRIGYLYYNLGLLLHRLKDFSGAADRYDTARRIFEEKARLADEQNDRGRAELFRQRQAEALNAMGALQASQGESRKAEESYGQALGLHPQLYAARHNLALLYSRQRARQGDAIARWEENTRMNPDYLPSQLSLASFYASENRLEAIEHYLAILHRSPDFRDALLGLGDVYRFQGNVPDACRQYAKAATQADGTVDWDQLDRRRRSPCLKKTASTAPAHAAH